jgi:hypothetical protein
MEHVLTYQKWNSVWVPEAKIVRIEENSVTLDNSCALRHPALAQAEVPALIAAAEAAAPVVVPCQQQQQQTVGDDEVQQEIVANQVLSVTKREVIPDPDAPELPLPPVVETASVAPIASVAYLPLSVPIVDDCSPPQAIPNTMPAMPVALTPCIIPAPSPPPIPWSDLETGRAFTTVEGGNGAEEGNGGGGGPTDVFLGPFGERALVESLEVPVPIAAPGPFVTSSPENVRLDID